MVNKPILDQAKAFLCWDMFPGLVIQLIEVQEAVSYFLPPSGRNTIVVYYERGNPDFSLPLFFLFHEVGHYLQFKDMEKAGKQSDFWEIINIPTGSSKITFEEESWSMGRGIFRRFIQKHGLDEQLLKYYNKVARRCVDSYC